MKRIFATGLAALLGSTAAWAVPTSILFVGNSYTFGRVNPVMSYNAANVTDLTASMAPGNAFEPHPWGGIAGIFKQFTVQANLDYDVSISARNAASLRGHAINPNSIANLDLLGNIGSKTWGKVVLQEQSDEPLTKRTVGSSTLASNPTYFKNYTNKLENYIHSGTAQSFVEADFFAGATAAARQTACVASGLSANTCSRARSLAANAKASTNTDVYLYETWARPNLVNAPFTTVTDPLTGAVSFTTTPATSFFGSLNDMTQELRTAYQDAASLASADGTAGIKGIARVGEAFQRAVDSGIATPNMYAPTAASDGLIDLWFDDGTHASKYGSYLSALTLFGTITGLDPASLGADEIAARDLGISGIDAARLQRVASDQLGFAAPVPEPAGWALMSVGLAALFWRRPGRRAA